MRFNGNKASKGISLVEVLIAIAVLTVGFLPIFVLLSDSRRISTKSVEEMQGISMATSMIDGLKSCPAKELLKFAGQRFFDKTLPAGLRLANLGIPQGPSNLERSVELRLLNHPIMPQERFSNPWGRILEIHVTVRRVQGDAKGSSLPRESQIYDSKGYLKINETE